LATNAPVQGFKIEVKSEDYFGNSTYSNASGFYEINIPAGKFILIISNDSRIFSTWSFSIEPGETKYKDFWIDSRIQLYKLSGHIYDAELNRNASNYKVNITDADDFEIDSTYTNFYGYYEFLLLPGEYTLIISKDGNEYEKDKITIGTEDVQHDVDIKEEREEENPFAWLNPNQIIKDIIDHWYFLVALILLLILVPIVLTLLDRFFDKISTRKFKILDERAIAFIENITRYNVYIAFIILLLFILAMLFPGFNDTVWQYIAPHIPAIYSIVILVILMRFFLLILRRVMDYLQGNLSIKPKLKLSSRYIGILEIILKYLIILIFGVNIIIIALAIFGMGDIIYKSFTGFLNENSGYLIFIIVIVIIMYFAGRFLRSFTEDMKRKETAKVSPQVADMIGKVGKIAIYLLGAMIIIFALLQMAQMGELGTTIITMMTLIIGIVVAMAATGSIGNILSGLVLNAFRPYADGDRVKIGDTIGDIVDTNLVFVRIKTLNGELVNIPNNTVIADKIYNFSKSGAFAVNVDVGIGYNVPSEHVKKFLIEAARDTKDIEEDPRPFVIITNLGDYAITYKLRAYTTNAKAMFKVRSNLMANVQKEFYSHGVEILSPWYLVRRDEKIPSHEQVMDSWEQTDKKTEEVISKETEDSIRDSFGLMDKAMSEEKQM
jgi:small-conductance mechanosensitive channel